jgi:hypothetical protein
MPTLRYLASALCLGLIAVVASENLFWMIPPPDLTPAGLVLAWLVYSLVAAAALSAVLLLGASGLWAAFLGGALLGYGTEGIVVGTIYEAFPAQLVWTPLAWHALVTGGIFLGLARTTLGAGTALLLWSAVAAAAVLWALYWPTERTTLPSHGDLAVYLVLPSVLLVAAHLALDRLLPHVPPRRSVLLAAPVLLALAWVAGTFLAPSWQRLAIWPCVALVLLALRRRAPGAGWGGGLPLWQAALPLLPATAVTLMAPPLWAALGPVPTNVPFALATSLAALALLLRALLLRSRSQRSAEIAVARSIAPS